MKYFLKSPYVYTDEGFVKKDVLIDRGRIFFTTPTSLDDVVVFNCNNLYVTPGFVDVHVHLREPGFFYKETIASGTHSAAKGGFTTVCPMPNVDPTPSTKEALDIQLELIAKDAMVRVKPYGAITLEQTGTGQLADMEALASEVVGFSDDGKGVQEGSLMEEAMVEAKRLGLPIVAHCEDESELKPGGCIHEGSYAKEHGLVGINSKSEWAEVKRDIELAEKTGCAFHVCHVSTKESVELIRDAKARGVDITCETAPHYLIFTEDDLQNAGRWKMNPPLRSAEDRCALLEGISDGTIDCIATDHAPHSIEEKTRGLRDSAFGVVGLETAFPALYTKLVLENPLNPESDKGLLTLEEIINLMSTNPAKRFNLIGGPLTDGTTADLTVLNLEESWLVDPDRFLTQGRATPFEGMELQGVVEKTFVGGELVYEREGGQEDA